MSHQKAPESLKNVTPSAVPPLFKADRKVKLAFSGRGRQDSHHLPGLGGCEDGA
jgi:hypothetical protein